MSQWAEIRQMHVVDGVPKKQIAERLGLDIKTVRRAVAQATAPAKGWEKGSVETGVKYVRNLVFRPRPTVATWAALNALIITELEADLATRRLADGRPVREAWTLERRHLRAVPVHRPETCRAELTTLLVEAQQQGRLARKLDHLARFDVVIVDELGYVPFDKAGADLLFGFISRRYERGSLVVTTNLPFARWSEVFLDATAAAAVIDRIVHHATVLTTNGDSYRLKAAQRNQTAHARQKKTR